MCSRIDVVIIICLGSNVVFFRLSYTRCRHKPTKIELRANNKQAKNQPNDMKQFVRFVFS